MVTIEADNYDEAIKKARAEKRRAKKQEKVDKIEREAAHLRAYANIGHIACSLLGDVNCHYWVMEPKLKCVRENTYACRFDGEGGTAEAEFYRNKPAQLLLNGAGFCLAVEYLDKDRNMTSWAAVGTFNNKYAFVELPEKLQNAIDEYLVPRQQEAEKAESEVA